MGAAEWQMLVIEQPFLESPQIDKSFTTDAGRQYS
jgi:hypothetical protein